MAEFTHTQGRYLAFIHAYTNLHDPPAESLITQDEMIGLERIPRILSSSKGMKNFGQLCRKVSWPSILCGKNAETGGPLADILLGRVIDQRVHGTCPSREIYIPCSRLMLAGARDDRY